MTDSRLQDSSPMLDEIDRLLAEIGSDTPTARPHSRPGQQFRHPDPSDPDVIIHEVKLTRYDKAICKLRDLEAKRAALPADQNPRMAAIIDYQIAGARKAVTAAQDDVTRKWEGIDRWRANEGREDYNDGRRDKRRKVRENPNADLSGLTDAEKNQRKNQQKRESKQRLKAAKATQAASQKVIEDAVKSDQALTDEELAVISAAETSQDVILSNLLSSLRNAEEQERRT